MAAHQITAHQKSALRKLLICLTLSTSSAVFLVQKRNVLVGASAFGLGDALAQSRLSKSTGGTRLRRAASAGIVEDPQRLRDATILGGVWAGACSPQVYRLSEWLLPGRSMQRVLMKTAISCGVLSSCGNWVNMFVRRACAGTSSIKDVVTTVNQDLPNVIRHDLCVWPFYDVLCFAVIPPALRPATTACVNAGWACYVSVVAARACQA